MRLSGSHQPTPDPSFSRIQNVLATAHQTAGAALGRATDRSPIKMHNLERYTGLEWHDHAKTAAALYTYVLEHAQTHHGIPLLTKDARNSTSDIARATLGRATPLAHPNAPSRALCGPGVARPRT